LLLAVACGGVAVAPAPETSPLAPGATVSGTLAAGDRRYWSLDGVSGALCVELGDLSASAALGVYRDNAFTQPLCAASTGAPPGECFLPAAASPLYVEVSAGAAAVSYTLGAFALAAAPYAPEGSPQAPLPLGAARAGQVGTRATSYYQATLGAGQHVVDVRCSTGAVDLHVYGDAAFSNELDCTLRANPGATTCTVTGPGTLAVSVGAGPINHEGAAYLLRVR
jgi:hypothetical protein